MREEGTEIRRIWVDEGASGVKPLCPITRTKNHNIFDVVVFC